MLPDAPPHPTLTDIAERAGVSAMTGSRARKAVRYRVGNADRIAKMAVKLGDRPDPKIAKLVLHVRSRTARASRA